MDAKQRFDDMRRLMINGPPGLSWPIRGDEKKQREIEDAINALEGMLGSDREYSVALASLEVGYRTAVIVTDHEKLAELYATLKAKLDDPGRQ